MRSLAADFLLVVLRPSAVALIRRTLEALGIEALSRGAAEVVFVESQASAVALIRRNLESLGIQKGATVIATEALRGLEKLAYGKKAKRASYDYIFLDPPYAAANDYARVLESLGS